MQAHPRLCKSLCSAGFGVAILGLASRSQAVLVTNVTTGTTIFSDNFESAPQISTADAPDTSVDADPVAQVGTWDTQDGSPPNAYGLEVQVTNDSSPGAFQGSNYLRIYRDSSYQNGDAFATFNAPATGQTIQLDTMVYLPANSPYARLQILLQGVENQNNSTSAWLRSDGSGGVSYVGPGFDTEPTGVSYLTGVWQKWTVDYVVDSGTFSLTVGNSSATNIPVFAPNDVGYIHFANGSNTPGSFYLDSPPSQATYTQTGSGDYNVSGNWSGAIPNAVDAEADFLGAITANHTVYSDTGITLGKIVFNNANTYVLTGAGSLKLQTSTGSALVDAQAGTQKILLPTEIASNTVLQAESGATLIMGGPVTIDPGFSLSEAGAGSVQFQSTITVDTGASAALAANSHAAGLSLANASTAALISETGSTKTALELDSLSIGTGSTFDLKNGELVVQNGSLSTIQQSVASGYNASGKSWGGTGITSSTAAGDTSHLTAVGVIQNIGTTGSALYSTFGGLPVSANAVLLKYTYYGDTNLDGTVDGTDYSRIDSAYETEQTTSTKVGGWVNGDFNYDGVVDGSDYTLIDNAFNSQGAAISAELSSPTAQVTAQIAGQTRTSAVPEPASLGMLLMVATGLLGRRSKN
jgi:hypothetical protein